MDTLAVQDKAENAESAYWQEGSALPEAVEYDTLHEAAKSKNSQAIHDMFKNRDPDPNVVDDNGNTPLFLAVSSGSVETVEALLERGASVEVSSLFVFHSFELVRRWIEN